MEDRAHLHAPSVGRRRFVLWLGGAGLLPLASSIGSLLGLSLGASAAGAQAGGGGGAGKPPATPPTAPATAVAGAAAAPEHTISDEAKALHGILMARYGKDLDAAQTQGLLEAVDGGVSSGQALRKHRLANAVEPATAFAATPMPASPAPKNSAAPDAKGGR